MLDIEAAILQLDELCRVRQSLRRRTIPTFLGVGAGRCGTTTLYNFLNRHPDVYMSPIKELNFFGVRSRNPRRPRGLSMAIYELFFSGYTGQKSIGEISPVYLSQPGAAEEIKEKLPDAKIIVTIRRPVERFLSQYSHHSKQHGFTDLALYVDTALQEHAKGKPFVSDWYHPTKNLRQSLYHDHVAKYFELFGRGNVLVIDYDDIAQHPARTATELCELLDIKVPQYSFEISNSSRRRETIVDTSVAEILDNFYKIDVSKTAALLNRPPWT